MFAPKHKRSSRRRRSVVTVGGIALAVLAVAVLVEIDPNALCLLPLLALALPLWLRRYPGERLLATLRNGRRARREGPVSVARASEPRLSRVVRGGLLLACSLAVRPPPLAPLAAPIA